MPSVLDVSHGEGILRERLEGLPFSSCLGIDMSKVAIARAESLADERTPFVVSDDVSTHDRFDVVV